MKKYLPIFLIYALYSGVLFADKSAHPPHLFRVVIYNNMAFNCDLQSSSIFYGRILPVTPIPIYLAPGSINQFFLIEGNDTGVSVRLAYDCEGARRITIVSRSDLNLRRRENRIRHLAFNALNMRAVVTKSEQNFLNNLSEINWVFEAT